MKNSGAACMTRPQARTARDHFWKRQGIKSVLWMVLPAVIVSGFYYPVLGFMVLLCMGASVGISFSRGRSWCDFCPRGTFFDMVMSRFSRNRPVPAFLSSLPFRIFMLVFLMGMMAFQLSGVWGDVPRMGMVFLMLLAVTTVIGVILAVPFKPRAWCNFCPMGSMASWISTGKQPLLVDPGKCTDCGACARVCPMELNPAAHREEGVMTDGDCLKCSRCVVQCGRSALCFAGDPKCAVEMKSPEREPVSV